jgi:hypothetical protein
MTANIVYMAPAAAKVWPRADLTADIDGLDEYYPKT